MGQERGRVVDIESLQQLDALVAAGATSMRGWRLQALDLTGRSEVLSSLDAAGAIVLGGRLEPPLAEALRRRGAIVFPAIPDLPVDPYRSSLYTPEELYAGHEHGYQGTLDARVYAWSSAAHTAADALARTLHDHAVDEALAEHLSGRRVVGVMGGHAMRRDSAAYAGAARLGRTLTRAGLLVATGGGPGAMEAVNLGAYLATAPDDALPDALHVLGAAPTFSPSVTAWVDAAFDCRRRWPGRPDSVGIPTWFYGHEPPNAFAGRIAKFFRNAVREDTLLRVSDAGLVVLPGAAGTVQEIFQDACENYYAAPGAVVPVVLVDVEHWTRRLPAWPLLQALAQGRAMADAVHLVESIDDVAAVLDAE